MSGSGSCHSHCCLKQTLTPAGSGFILPAVIADQGEKAAERFFTFFTDTIPNANTRAAYYYDTMRFFAWTHAIGLSLDAIKSYHVSGYPHNVGRFVDSTVAKSSGQCDSSTICMICMTIAIISIFLDFHPNDFNNLGIHNQGLLRILAS